MPRSANFGRLFVQLSAGISMNAWTSGIGNNSAARDLQPESHQQSVTLAPVKLRQENRSEPSLLPSRTLLGQNPFGIPRHCDIFAQGHSQMPSQLPTMDQRRQRYWLARIHSKDHHALVIWSHARKPRVGRFLKLCLDCCSLVRVFDLKKGDVTSYLGVPRGLFRERYFAASRQRVINRRYHLECGSA